MDRLPNTQHELQEWERDTRSSTPEFDAVLFRSRRLQRSADFHYDLAQFVAGGATVVPRLTNDQAGCYGAVFAARMSVVIAVWRQHDEGRCSQMLSSAIAGMLLALDEAAAEPTKNGPGPDALEACALAAK